jgi:hypothetical protein
MSDKLKPFHDAPEDIKAIIIKVLELEKTKLDTQNPRLKSEVVDIVKTLVTENDLDDENSDYEENT